MSVLGRVGGDAAAVVRGSSATPMAEGRWGVDDRVGFSMPLANNEGDLRVHIDAILPRVTELATSSMSYREKAAACELLEAAVKLCIGTNATAADRSAGRSSDFSAHYRHLFPAMLRLATDADGFARKLFEPLTQQLIRWLTSNQGFESADTVTMLEAVMDAVADPTHSGLREFAARCLGEFVKYSIKQSRASSSHGNKNIQSLLQRLFGLAQHPSAMHRLAFAFALNSAELYRELREDAATLDLHALELTQKALLALRLAQTDPEALGTAAALTEVVSHLERMLKRHAPALLKENSKRPAFAGGLGGRDGFMVWLFAECAQPKAHARLRCSKLFEQLCLVIPVPGGSSSGTRPCASTAEWVRGMYSTTPHELPVCRRFVRPQERKQSVMHGEAEDDGAPDWWALRERPPPAALRDGGDELLQRWLEQVQAALDLTYWTLKQKHLTLESLLDGKGLLRGAVPALHALLDTVVARAAAMPSLRLHTPRTAELSACTRETLKAAFRLVHHALTEARGDARLGIVLREDFDAAGADPSSRAPPAGTTSVLRAALLATLRPTLLGFDPSEVEQCKRMREHSCGVVALMHARSAGRAVETLAALVREDGASLDGLPGADALASLALLDGYVGLHRLSVGNSLLGRALPTGAAELAQSLALQAANASSSASPLEVQVLSQAVQLSLLLGLDSERLVLHLLDPSPATEAQTPTSRGQLFSRRFRDVLLPHLAMHPSCYAATLLLGSVRLDTAAEMARAQRRALLGLLLALLDHHSSNVTLPSEALVEELAGALPAYLSAAHWPSEEWLDDTLALFRRLLTLGGHIVLRPAADGGPSVLLSAWLQLLRASRELPRRASEEAFKLLPSMLRRLRLPAAPGSALGLVIDAVRGVLEATLPLSFHELSGPSASERKREVQALLVPLLDAVSDPRVRSLELLQLLLEQPAVVEQHLHGGRAAHSFADGVATSLRDFVQAVGTEGGGACACDVPRLWQMCTEVMFGTSARWARRHAVLHLVALPLAHSVATATLVDVLLKPVMPQLVEVLSRARDKVAMDHDASAVHSELVRRAAAFELFAVLMFRLEKAGRDVLDAAGALGVAAGGQDVFKDVLVRAAGKATKEETVLPAISDVSAMAVASSLRTRLQVAAYSALIEAIVRTQNDPKAIDKVLFNKWEPLWEHAVDHSRQYELKAETDFASTSEGARLALHSRVTSRRRAGAKAMYMPSQVLMDSSFSQEAGEQLIAAGADRASLRSAMQRAAVGQDVPASQTQASQASQQGSDGGGETSGSRNDSTDTGEGGGEGADEASSGDYELDELNRHPLMDILMRCVSTLEKRELVGSDELGMPLWMSRLNKLLLGSKSLNTRLLVARLVFNRCRTRSASAPDEPALRARWAELRGKGVTLSQAAVKFGVSPLPAPGAPPRAEATLQEVTRAARGWSWWADEAIFVPEAEFKQLMRDARPLFSAHARHWAKPLLHLVMESVSQSKCFHYLARDLLGMVCDWKAQADDLGEDDPLPAGEEVSNDLSLLVAKLCEFCQAEQAALLRTNVATVKMLLELWSARLRPRRLIVKRLLRVRLKDNEKLEARQRLAGVLLLDALLANQLSYHDDPNWKPTDRNLDGDLVEYTPVSAQDMQEALLMVVRLPSKRLYEPAARVLGFVLKRAGEAGDSTSDIEKKLFAHLHSLNNTTQQGTDQLLVLLDALSFGCPELLLRDFATFGRVAYGFIAKVYGSARVHVLNCLSRCVLLERADAVAEAGSFRVELKEAMLRHLLKQQQADTQLASLHLCRALCERRGADTLVPLLEALCDAFDRHPRSECRQVYQQLLLTAHSQLKDSPDAGGLRLRAALLHGLSDKDEGLRSTMLSYWHNAVLPRTAAERLVSCFSDLHAPAVEGRWLHNCGVLLLQLSSDSGNYEKPLFDKPLQDGLKLQEYRVQPTEGASSDAMLPWGTQSQSQSQSQSQLGSQDGGGAGYLRATQAAMFTQTQENPLGVAGANLSTYSSQGDGVALFAVGAAPAARPPVPTFDEAPQGPAVGRGSSLVGRRFRPGGGADFDSVRSAVRKRALENAASGRAATVTRYRTYRIGELPDIQISARDILAPLGSLLHHDPLVAKLMFARLYAAVREQKAVDSTRLHDGVCLLLRSRHGGPAFVACLHELAQSEGSLEWLPPDVIADSAKLSGNLHSGVRLLEKHLLTADGGPPGAKRARPSAGADVAAGGGAEARKVKVLLADLYRSLGDEDVVRALASEITQSLPIRNALAADARGDASAALSCFKEALDGDNGGLRAEERELARLGRRSCHELLNQWERLREETEPLMARALREASRLGAPADRCAANLSEPWVREWVVSRCKLAGAEDERVELGWGAWPAEADEAVASLAPSPKRDRNELLAHGYGALLLLDRLVEADVNGARALLPRCSSAFVERWATLHPLATAARKRELRPLQLVAEAEELVGVLGAKQLVRDPGTGNWGRVREQRAMLASWCKRLPSETLDDVTVWDDLICGRLRMLHLLRETIRKEQAPLLEADDKKEQLASFDADCKRCLLATYEAAAVAARRQGNFGAAQVFLKKLPPLRQGLGETADLGSTTAIVSLQLERAVARFKGPKLHQELLNAHRMASSLANDSASSGGLASASQRRELDVLRASIAWQLAQYQHGSADLFETPVCTLVQHAEESLRRVVAEMEDELVSDGSQLAARRLQLADLCDGAAAMSDAHRQSDLAAIGQEQVLKAMAAGSLEASNRLPTVLAKARNEPGLWEPLQELLQLPPAWMYLGWVSQLIAMINEPHGVCVGGVLQQLAKEYPQAVYFAWQARQRAPGPPARRDPAAAARAGPRVQGRDRVRCAPLAWQVSRTGLLDSQATLADHARAATTRSLDKLLASPTLEALTAGFNNLTNPDLRLADWIKEAIGQLSDGRFEEAAEGFKEIWRSLLQPRARGGHELRGDLLLDFADAFGPQLRKVCGQDGANLLCPGDAVRAKAAAKVCADGLNAKLREIRDWTLQHMKKKRINPSRPSVEHFSTFLASYHSSDATRDDRLAMMEMPGQ